MEIIIHQAILHVLDTTLDAPVLSGGGMELTAEKTAYLQNHIEKLLASDEIRQCRPILPVKSRAVLIVLLRGQDLLLVYPFY